MRYAFIFIVALFTIELTSCKHQSTKDSEPPLSNTNLNLSDSANQTNKFSCGGANGKLINEHKEVKEGNKILISGGNNSYLLESTGKDSLLVEVDKIFFSKPMGKVAFLKSSDFPKNVYYSISLYYWDSVRGYNESCLIEWHGELDKQQIIKFNRDWTTKVKYSTVDSGIRFKIIN